MTLPRYACVLLLLPALGEAALVTGSNFQETSGRQLPITTAAGDSIQQGGIVQVGSFGSSDVAALIGALPPTAARDALIGDFIPFTDATSIGFNFNGLFITEKLAPLAGDSPLIGKPVYTLIGDGPTFAQSTQLGLVRHPVVFGPDEPLFAAWTDISDPYAVVLLGSSGPSATTALGFSPTSLGLARAIPEPTSGTLMLLAGVMLLRRRRRDETKAE